MTEFIDSHFEVGELYAEFQKCDKCEFCKSHPWVKYIDRVPRPIPNENGKFLDIADTTVGQGRLADDFQPRCQLKKLYGSGGITSQNKEQIQNFAKKFAVDEGLVIKHLHHLEYLEFKKKKRTIQRVINQMHTNYTDEE